MKSFLKTIVSLLVCYSVSLLVLVTAHAQSTTLSVNPPVVEILLAPNKKVTQTFTFHVEGVSTSITPEIHLVKPGDNAGHVEIDASPVNPASLPLIITSSLPLNTPYNLPHNTSDLALTLTLEAASTDIPIDVYLALVIRLNPTLNESSISNLATLSPGISALLLTTITPSGTMPINLDIQNFSPKLIYDSWDPITITPEVENHIPIMVHPVGTYTIISPRGKSIVSQTLYPNLVLGNSRRTLKGDAGDNQPPTPLTWQPHWYNVGPYRLKLTLTTQGQTKITETEKVVWIFPIRLGIITLTLAMGLLYTFYRFKNSPKID